MRFEDVYSELRPAKPLRFPFHDLISFGFADDVIDDNGAKHDDLGRFTGGGAKEGPKEESGESDKKEEFDPEKLKELYGEEFTGVYRNAAVGKLLEERKGHVKKAFHRDDIGDIDLIWGDDHVGIQHLMLSRGKQPKINSEEFLSDLNDVITKGAIIKNPNKDNYEIWSNHKLCVISRTFFGKKMSLIITVYPSEHLPAKFKKAELQELGG